jgi:hypothetical protein
MPTKVLQVTCMFRCLQLSQQFGKWVSVINVGDDLSLDYYSLKELLLEHLQVNKQ